jgi:hypothetical protein
MAAWREGTYPPAFPEIIVPGDAQMTVTYLKKAEKTALSESASAREVAERMLAKIAEGREEAVRA